MTTKTVLLGLSGGVDSAVAALILKQQGYHVTGAFMKNFSDTKNKLTGECSWRDDYRMAQKVAAHLNIPLIKLDFEREYTDHVIKPMIKGYKQGITPNPDITCNTLIKFPLLRKEAIKRGFDYIATGHYVRSKKTAKGYSLYAGKDVTKDQSYFLYELTQQDLARTLFPLGSMKKEATRDIAQRHRFPNYDRQSSRGVCFVGNVPLKNFLEKSLKPKKGHVVNEHNQPIGTHIGAFYYTIGERVRPTTGITITKGTHAQERFFIAHKNMKKNKLTVVPEGHPLLYTKEIHIKNVHWINPLSRVPKKIHVRIRHLGTLIPATFTKNRIVLSKPLTGVAPGQSAAIYHKNELLGGGEIAQ